MPERQRLWVVDSIEEGIAAVEQDGERIVHVPAWILPAGVSEGDVLSVKREDQGGAAVLTVRIDREATERAFARSREQLRDLATHDPGGDIVL